ncbi:zinc finger protein 154-like [Polypterus senegalus]|uniref:zinc finger protein 154-like n=1 Tax=Polypterus senegalus TaxID=55291 RepID=UPI0019659211|nr:zinc finger protein 154-like [Polypterus senegalus]
MASEKKDGNGKRLPCIKQEDCEWETAPEGLRVKLEDCEGAVYGFKEEECQWEIVEVKVEDSEEFAVSPELQKQETWEKTFKQDVGDGSHSSLQHPITRTGQLATRPNPLELKSEVAEFEEKTAGGNEGEVEELQASRSGGINFPEDVSLSVSSFAQTSLQCRLQQKLDKEKMKKSTRGSENLTAASFQCRSFPAARLIQTEAFSTEEYPGQNLHQEAVSASQGCEKTFKIKSDCNDEPVHSVQKPQARCESGSLFAHRNSLQVFKRVHNGEKTPCCQVCGKQFPSKSALQRHMHVHTGEKPYSCAKCGKSFSRNSSLHNHSKIHLGERPYRCSECGKGFSFLGNFHDHLRIHSGEKPYCCSECGKRFIQGSSLRRHIRTHTGEKPHCCSECGKQFSDGNALQRHRRIHTGEKPYCCSECGKQFSDSSALQKHRRIHTGEKPYCCSECGKGFTVSSNLRQHERIHIRRKSHSCSEK